MGSPVFYSTQYTCIPHYTQLVLYSKMLSTISDGAEFVIFILQWFIGWIMESPHVLIIIILLVGATIYTWRFLKQMTMPTILSSPQLSLMLLLGLLIVTMRGYNTNQQLLGLENDLDNAHWRIRQGGLHRMDLLKQIEMAGMIRKKPIIKEENVGEKEENALDGCLHVFLTAGASNALPIRKLYEPNQFPLSPMQPFYEELFGTPRSGNHKEICTVSFKPSAAFVAEKQSLSKSYGDSGIRVIVYHADIGHKNTDAEENKAEVVRIAKYITTVVAGRKLPDSATTTTPKVALLLGGSLDTQMKVIPDLVVSGPLGQVDTLLVEGRGDEEHKEMVDSVVALGELTRSEGMERKFDVKEVDDQTYPEYEKMPVKTC